MDGLQLHHIPGSQAQVEPNFQIINAKNNHDVSGAKV